MKNKIQKFFIIILIFIVVIFNRKIIPSRKEIEDLEITKVIGLDSSSDDKIKFSISKNKGESNDEPENEVLTVRSDSFKEATRDIENYILKQYQGGHIKYFLIGDSAARESISKYFSFILHDSELRLNGKVFIIKDESAESMLKKGQDIEYQIDEKLKNMENSLYESELYVETTILDVLKNLTSRYQNGVIPSIRLIEEETRNTIEFSGYGIMKNGRIIDYLSVGASRAYGFVNKNVKNTNITVEDNTGDTVTLNVTNTFSDIDFKFKEDELEKIIVNIGFESSINEKYNESKIIDEKYLENLEYKQNFVIEKELEELFSVSQKMENDFVKINNYLELKHPYKWYKLENNWDKTFSNSKIEIIVNSKIERTFDIDSIDKEGV